MLNPKKRLFSPNKKNTGRDAERLRQRCSPWTSRRTHTSEQKTRPPPPEIRYGRRSVAGICEQRPRIGRKGLDSPAWRKKNGAVIIRAVFINITHIRLLPRGSFVKKLTQRIQIVISDDRLFYRCLWECFPAGIANTAEKTMNINS